MDIIIRSKLVKIGNSQGVRIPKPLLEQTGLSDEVELVVQGDKLIIRSPQKNRQGWEVLFARMDEQNDDRLLDELTTTIWDETDWRWE